MNRRQIALIILSLRALLTEVAVARACGHERDARLALDTMDSVARMLPLGLQRRESMNRYVHDPVTRRIGRDGILAASRRIGYRL